VKDKILEWKAVYGNVYMYSIEGQDIYYRTLNGWEIQSVLELKSNNKASLDVEMAMCVMAVLHPEPLPSFSRPGSISTLSSEIWTKSFPTESTLPDLTEQNRKWAKENLEANFNIALSSILCKVMPSLDFAHLMDLPLSKLVKIAAIVEEILQTPILSKDGNFDNNNNAQAGAVRDGYGVSQEEANKASAALSNALKSIKK
tara:strand:+ start:16167 stop:16769 length:603 start_codon:yes stop_codon:yes gene_type:complete